ncbi:nucleotidyl transferase AbiEii/AbiGii toxin family protein [Candidatus Woesearchaeota archaeon]|nr:nucleotidyl transferase AbiEii/AbiGii toxin family protein [Candidatus Woesearchaeota archaeon]
MITKEILMEIGKKKGLTNKEYIEKDYFQDLFLFHLFKKTNKLIFKGGTALYKLYGLKRFSEDLDFSLLENLNTKSIEQIIRDMVENTGCFKIKSIKETKDSLLIKISCKGILTKYNTLRIDINFKNKVIKGFDIKNYISEFIDINPFSLRSLKLEEIISEKIHALFTREKARDVYDLFFLLRISALDKKLTQEKLKIFDIKYNPQKIAGKIENIKAVWEKELNPFVLDELPTYKNVKKFVIEKLKLK